MIKGIKYYKMFGWRFMSYGYHDCIGVYEKRLQFYGKNIHPINTWFSVLIKKIKKC